MEDLKRCPFCGRRAKMEDQVSTAPQTIMARKISIKCTFCGASTREFIGLLADEVEDAQIMAIEAWNIRPKKGRG